MLVDRLHIKKEDVGYSIETVIGYLMKKNGYSIEEANIYMEENEEIGVLINQIIALKWSNTLLRHTTVCESLSVDLVKLKNSLIKDLKDKYNIEFDETILI